MLFKMNAFYFALLTVLATVNGLQQRCVLPLPRYAFFAPLIFSPNGSLIYSENVSELVQDITIPYDEKVVISCAPNYFKDYPSDKVLDATCQGQKDLLVKGEVKNFLRQLACEVRVVEEIIKPVAGCPETMDSIEFGYTNPIKEKSLILGEACYSTDKGKTLFVHTKIAEADSDITVNLKTADSVNYFLQKHPESKYKMDFLMASRLDTLNERLAQVLGTKNVPFIEPRNFVGLNLLPNKQFLSTLKLGWNYVPVIGYDHMPNLNVLYGDIANLKGGSFDFYVGTHGILELSGESGGKHEIYMGEQDDRFPVPKYIWIVVKQGKKAAAFTVLNNPEGSPEANDSICHSKCEEMTWLKGLLEDNRYQMVKEGAVDCCSYDDFKAKVTEMPLLEKGLQLLV